ncbi:MAG: paaG2 [Frankiales bacterium]|nr:paaG2 [Frankiales bacterium]
MTGQHVRYAFTGGAARLTLAGSSGNPLHLPMGEELLEAVRLARTDDARVVLLRAEGPAFCVGGDVGAFGSTPDRERLVDDMAEQLHRTISELHRMDAVVVAVVQGVAAGAGVTVAAAADVVLAGTSARFTLAYTKIGLSPDGGSSLLTASLGLHRALRLALLNPVLTADEAREAGLVAAVHPDAELDDAAERVVAQLLTGSRTAQVAAKRLLREQATPRAEGAMRLEALSIRACAASPDGVEGVDAFLAKRRPEFPSTR